MKARKIFILTLTVVLLLAVSSISPILAQNDTLVIWADETRAPLLQVLAEEFEAEFGVTVEILQIGTPDARDRLLVEGPVGEGPDILIAAHDSIGVLVANGAIVPIDLGDLEDQFVPAALDLFTYQNQLWGVPYVIENVALIRNVDLVPERPRTWEEVREIGEELQESGMARYGFIAKTGDTYHNFPITTAFGGYIFGLDDEGNYDVTDIGLGSEGGLASAQWLSEMYSDGLMPPGVDDDVMFELFISGDAAMFVTGPWFSERIALTGVNYAIDPLPTVEGSDMEIGVPFSGGQGFVISAFSDNQLLAETFLLDFVATQEFMQAIFELGRRPPVFFGVDTSGDPNMEDFLAAGEFAVPMPAIPEMGAVWAASNDALTLISQGADPIESYETAVTQIRNAIQLVQATERIVVVAGSLQSEAGCPGDWDPACLLTQLEHQGDGIFSATFALPAGDYEYKVAMNGGWGENYGADGVADGPNILLSLSEDTEVTFTYDDSTRVVTDSVNEG